MGSVDTADLAEMLAFQNTSNAVSNNLWRVIRQDIVNHFANQSANIFVATFVTVKAFIAHPLPQFVAAVFEKANVTLAVIPHLD